MSDCGLNANKSKVINSSRHILGSRHKNVAAGVMECCVKNI